MSSRAPKSFGVLRTGQDQGKAPSESLGMPHSRPMPGIGGRCHELRVRDESTNWRLIYRVDADAIVLLEVFAKKTGKTPAAVIRACKARLKRYDELA